MFLEFWIWNNSFVWYTRPDLRIVPNSNLRFHNIHLTYNWFHFEFKQRGKKWFQFIKIYIQNFNFRSIYVLRCPIHIFYFIWNQHNIIYLHTENQKSEFWLFYRTPVSKIYCMIIYNIFTRFALEYFPGKKNCDNHPE